MAACVINIKLYGAPFWQKLITFMHTNFRATQNFFNQHNMYLYTTGTIFCQHVFIFCATLNIFSIVNMGLSFGCHIIFFLATTYFFVTHIILVRDVTFV